MTLKRDLDGWLWHRPRFPKRPERSVQTRIAIRERFGNVQPVEPPSRDLDQLLARVAYEFGQDSLSSLSPRDRRMLPWILFYPPGQEHGWLGRDARFTKTAISLLEHSKPAVLGALVTVLLKCYPDCSTLDTWRTFVRDQVMRHRSIRLDRWRERQEQYGLFEVDGPRRLAAACHADPTAATATLEEAGLNGLLAEARFLTLTVRAYLESMNSRLESGDTSAEDLSSRLEFLIHDGALRVPELRGVVGDDLLLPFADSPPSESVQETLRKFFLGIYGDPRANAGAWLGVSDEAKDVMRKWLVARVLEAFFAVLDRTALDRHWQDRKAFWTVYLKQGVVEDAWIALGKDAMRLLPAALRDQPHATLSYGDESQSVLLMRIAGATIAEWSHNGKCVMWLPGSDRAPSLDHKVYDRRALRDYNADHAVIHHQGLWRDRTSRWIRDNTGVRYTGSW